jgi:nucleoside-diphosphate-sugar epimerase
LLMRAHAHLATHELAFTGAAGTVLAAIGQADACIDGSLQNGRVRRHGKVALARLYIYLKSGIHSHFYNIVMLKSLSARFRKPSLAIVGCGDIGMRVVQRLSHKFRIIALTSQPSRRRAFRAAGVRALVGNLDTRESMPALQRLAAFSGYLLHLAPPQNTADTDLRTLRLINALRHNAGAKQWVYVSTTGVYGDHQGAMIDETAPLKPLTDRAIRRIDAEHQFRAIGAQLAARVTLLRVPGIYDAQERSPRARLLKGAPALQDDDDVYTNHIHADDLARICVLSLFRGKAQRVINTNDDTQMKMGEYFDIAADAMQLPRPVRISHKEAQTQLSPMQMSFMRESRRLSNARMKKELKVKLLYPQVTF